MFILKWRVAYDYHGCWLETLVTIVSESIDEALQGYIDELQTLPGIIVFSKFLGYEEIHNLTYIDILHEISASKI